MTTFNSKDIQHLFVGAAANKTTGRIGTLNDGEIGIFTKDGTRMTEALAATERYFRIVQGRGTGEQDIVGPLLDKQGIVSATLKEYAAGTEQITAIGYNGTDGAIDVINDNLYKLTINLNQQLVSNHGGLYLKHGFYKSDSAATQSEIAAGICESLVYNFSREPERLIKFERINSGARLVDLDGAGFTIAVNRGNPYITFSGDASASVTAGSIVRFGTGAGTSPCYVVEEAVSTTVYKLDIPYQGDSATAVASSETVTEGNWGILLTGLALTATPGKRPYNPTKWDTTLTDFGTTNNRLSQASSRGTGTAKHVKELEWFCQGNEGDFYRMGEPALFTPRAEVTTGTYDLVDVVVEQVYTGSIVAGPVRQRVTLAIPSTAPQYAVTGTGDDISDVLEVLAFGSATGALAMT